MQKDTVEMTPVGKNRLNSATPDIIQSAPSPPNGNGKEFNTLSVDSTPLGSCGEEN